MLERLKILIFKNFFLFLAIFFTSFLLYLTFLNFYFLFLLILVLLGFNFYYLRGFNLFFYSLVSHFPFYFLYLLTDVNKIFLILLWIIYYFSLIKNNYLSTWLFAFLSYFNLFLLFNYLNFFLVFLISLFVNWLIFYFVFKFDFLSSLVKTTIILQFFWLAYFWPVNFYLALIATFLFFIYLTKINFV